MTLQVDTELCQLKNFFWPSHEFLRTALVLPSDNNVFEAYD